MREKVVIGTRGSELALWQANFVRSRIEAEFPEIVVETKIIKTTGDEFMDTAISKIGDKGLFTRQIESELLDRKIDLAVHSLKDLQTVQPDGLAIGAVCEREAPNDVLITKTGKSLDQLPSGATIATGSLRRRCQLLAYRPDFEIEDIRGNVPTRLRKFDESDLDGLVLAFAGLHRLELADRISEMLSPPVMLPAVGQGAIAVEIRSDDEDVKAIVGKLDHAPTRLCTSAERAFLRRLEGGCQVPIGALAEIDGELLRLKGMVGSLDGGSVIRDTIVGGVTDSMEELGVRLAEVLIEKGADRILRDVRASVHAAA